MVFPWIPFLISGKKRLSDIEFLAIKDFDGKLRQDDGVVTTSGDVATLTATAGKDMYLAKAAITTSFTVGSAGTKTLNVELKLNGVTVETYTREYGSTGAQQGDSADNYEFINIGQKVAATQIIKLEVTGNTGSLFNTTGTIVCFEETTGESPQIG